MRARALPLLLAAALAAGACGRPAEPPVARLAAQPKEIRLPFPQHAVIDLEWVPLRALDPAVEQPLVFLHLLDREEEVVRTFDHPFPERWVVGRTVSYEVVLAQSALAPPLAAGAYDLVAGLYDGTDHRWPLQTEAGELRRREHRLGVVTAPDAAGGPARFDFGGGWLPIERGADRQVLARRWLYGSGTVALRDAPAGSTVRVVLAIPEPELLLGELHLREDRGEPAVHLQSDCSSKEWVGAGAGRHEAELPLDLAPADGSACSIRIEPNFYLEQEGLEPPRSVVLEALSWRPPPGGEGSAAEAP